MQWVKLKVGWKLPENEWVMIQLTSGVLMFGQVQMGMFSYYDPETDRLIEFMSVRDPFSACVSHYCIVQRAEN